MYQIGDRVIYGIHGVCDVTDLEEKMIDRKKMVYLVLEPVGQTGSRFLVPAHNAAAMAKIRRILTVEEWEALLRSEAVRADGWIRDEGARKNVYRELVGSCDREKLLQMICTLYRHKAAQAAAGKKVHLSDDNFLRDAERLMASEISVVMGMDMDQARKYIREKLKEDA